MLRFLRIRNLAVIEAVDVEFDAGFNVLTGETGAGKSILVEAVGLLLGGRASSELVRTGEAQATIEAIFEDDGQEIVVRREITSQGRSRSFVNGALATAGALRDLASRLVELHGQHEHQALLDPQTHLPILDGFARLEPLVERVATAWVDVRTRRDQLERSRMDIREKAARLELVAFQLAEIEKAAPKPGEDEELGALRQLLANAERIERLCAESYAALYASDGSVLGSLGGVWKRVSELASIDTGFAPYVAARDGIKSQLEDLADFLRSYADGVDASPERLQQVDDRLVQLERLKRKYGPALQDVIDTAVRLRQEHQLLAGDGEGADALQQALAVASEAYLHVAGELSRARRAAAGTLARALEEMLAELAMARTTFEVRMNEAPVPESAWSERGIDEAQFFVSANVGEEVRPLARVVSGGELSRIMLALKTMASVARGAVRAAGRSQGRGASTLIFDEVDAGIGGRVADVVGARLRALGTDFQVLCITHLPQIAARGTTHFHIDKQTKANRTVTSVTRLDPAGRVEEIARMIGGASITDPVRAGARDLLATATTPVDRGRKVEGESERRKRK